MEVWCGGVNCTSVWTVLALRVHPKLLSFSTCTCIFWCFGLFQWKHGLLLFTSSIYLCEITLRGMYIVVKACFGNVLFRIAATQLTLCRSLGPLNDTWVVGWCRAYRYLDWLGEDESWVNGLLYICTILTFDVVWRVTIKVEPSILTNSNEGYVWKCSNMNSCVFKAE